MPHLTIEYSSNLDVHTDKQGLCDHLHGILLASGMFEMGAVRVRAKSCPSFAIADLLAENAFADPVLRIGQGRSDADRKSIGKELMTAAETYFANLLANPHFALSL